MTPSQTGCLLLGSAWRVPSSEAQLWHSQLHSTTSFILNVISGDVLIVFDWEMMGCWKKDKGMNKRVGIGIEGEWLGENWEQQGSERQKQDETNGSWKVGVPSVRLQIKTTSKQRQEKHFYLICTHIARSELTLTGGTSWVLKKFLHIFSRSRRHSLTCLGCRLSSQVKEGQAYVEVTTSKKCFAAS